MNLSVGSLKVLAVSAAAAMALGVAPHFARRQGLGFPALCTKTVKRRIRFSAEAPFLISMVLCRSRACMASFNPAIGAFASARLVYFARIFALEPNDQVAAQGLLSSLPTLGNSQAYTDVGSLSAALWPEETYAQMFAGEKIMDSLSREAGRAAVLRPSGIPQFLRYSLIAITNPEDQIGRAAVRVCRLRHRQFLTGLSRLSKGDRENFECCVVDPKGCRQIHFSEADGSLRGGSPLTEAAVR